MFLLFFVVCLIQIFFFWILKPSIELLSFLSEGSFLPVGILVTFFYLLLNSNNNS